MKKSKIIITGADGFIGSAVANKFLQLGHQVLALDIKETPTRLIKSSKLTYIQWDMFDNGFGSEALEDLLPASYDVFLHFGWAGSSGADRKNLTLQQKNAMAIEDCVYWAYRFGCKKFIGAGSLMEYEVECATHTDNKLTSINYYGYGKLLAHYIAKKACQDYNIDFIWGIITNAYGPQETSPRFINSTMKKIINNTELRFNSSGLQNYDFIYIDDLVQAFYLLATNEASGEYILGSGLAKPLYKFVLEMIKICDKNIMPLFDLSNDVDCSLPVGTFDISKLKELGWSQTVSFEEGIKRLKDWMEKENEKISIL